MNFPSIFLFFLKVPLLIRVIIQLRSVQVYPEKKIMDIKYWQKKIQLEHNYSKGTFRKKNIMDFNYWHMKRQLEYSYSTLIQLWSVKVPSEKIKKWVPIWVGLLYRNYAPIVLFCVKILIPLFIYFSGDMVTDTSWICTVIVFKYYFLVSIF
jgi:hypothetical protein